VRDAAKVNYSGGEFGSGWKFGCRRLCRFFVEEPRDEIKFCVAARSRLVVAASEVERCEVSFGEEDLRGGLGRAGVGCRTSR